MRNLKAALPPAAAKWFLALLCRPDWREEIEGDIDELFRKRVDLLGARQARRLYFKDVLSLYRSFRNETPTSGTRKRKGDGLMQTLFQDVRYGVRTLVQNRGFTAVAVLTLAIGIGANTAIFTLIDATLFAGSPGRDTEELLSVFSGSERNPYSGTSYPDYVDIRDNVDAFSGFATYGGITLTWDTGEQTETLSGMVVSGNYFSLLGLDPAGGRFFVPEEDQTPGTHPVAVISHRLWDQRYGGDDTALGSQMTLNGQLFTVIGVAPARFTGRNITEDTDVWVPTMMQQLVRPPRAGFSVGMDANLLDRRGARWLNMFGRLKPGGGMGTASASLQVVANRLENAYPDTNSGVLFTPYPADSGSPQARSALAPAGTLLMVVVGLVLLIACANVANLLLARATARRVEIATRIALGAGRGRLIRQFLTESLLLSLFGGIGGLALAVWGTNLLVAAIMRINLLPITITLDAIPNTRVLLFTLGACLGTAGLFGLVPAIEAARTSLNPVIRGVGRWKLRSAFVVSQVAISVLLLIGTGLFLRSLQKTQAIDPGFETDSMLLMPLSINLVSYSEQQGRAFYDRVLEETGALPGVESAAVARVSALGGGGRRVSVLIEGQTPPPQGSPNIVGANVVSLNYFRTMGMPLLAGRDFSRTDGDGAPLVCIVNEAMAARYWPGENAIGKRLQLGRPDSPRREVIGITRDGKYVSLVENLPAFVYFPLLQNHESGVTLHVRTSTDPTALINPIQAQVRNIEPNLPVANVRTMSEQMSASLFPAHLGVALIAVFGALALALASVGVYGVMSYSMARRTREIGIRMALGARQADVFAIVLGEAAGIVGIGVGIGLIAALAATRLVEGFLYGVSSRDPISFVSVALAMIVVALVAGYVPARRATRVDPVAALRCE